MPWTLTSKSSKIVPLLRRKSSSGEVQERRASSSGEKEEEEAPFAVVRLHTLMKRYGGLKHPKIEPYEVFKQRGEIMDYKDVPLGSTVVFLSHLWMGSTHPDPDGTLMNHFLRIARRLQEKKISKVEMNYLHVHMYVVENGCHFTLSFTSLRTRTQVR